MKGGGWMLVDGTRKWGMDRCWLAGYPLILGFGARGAEKLQFGVYSLDS
jgi:hypothetical protein